MMYLQILLSNVMAEHVYLHCDKCDPHNNPTIKMVTHHVLTNYEELEGIVRSNYFVIIDTSMQYCRHCDDFAQHCIRKLVRVKHGANCVYRLLDVYKDFKYLMMNTIYLKDHDHYWFKENTFYKSNGLLFAEYNSINEFGYSIQHYFNISLSEDEFINTVEKGMIVSEVGTLSDELQNKLFTLKGLVLRKLDITLFKGTIFYVVDKAVCVKVAKK